MQRNETDVILAMKELSTSYRQIRLITKIVRHLVMLPLFTHFVAFEYYLSLFVYNVGVNTNAW